MLVVLAALSLAQVAPKADPATFSGTVHDSVTGEPVKDAVVVVTTLTGTRIQRGVSDADGGFTIPDVSPGRYYLSAERAGFVDTRYGAAAPGAPGVILRASAGETQAGLAIHLVPGVVIAGRVLDARGRPLPDSIVTALRETYVRGRRTLVTAGSYAGNNIWANDLGEYRLWGLPPGRYYVIAAPRSGGWAPLIAATDVGAGTTNRFVQTYYPSARDRASAGAIEAKAGETVEGADITLREGPATVTVRGHVEGDPGPDALRVAVSLIPADSTEVTPTVSLTSELTKDMGKPNKAEAAPGRYVALMSANRVRGSILLAREEIEIGPAPLTELVFTAQPPLALPGTITIESPEDPPPGPTQLRAEIRLRDPLPGYLNRNTYAPVAPAADGSFEIPWLMRDRFELDITGLPAGYYVASATLGDTNVWDDGLDLTGGVPGPLAVLIRDGAATVHGTLKNAAGNPATGTVVLAPVGANRRQREHWFRVTQTGPEGEFSLADVAPGDYRVFAWEAVEETAWLDPEFLAKFEDQAALVTIPRRKAMDLAVTLPSQ